MKAKTLTICGKLTFMASANHTTQNSLLISTENLYQIKEARYQLQKMQEALSEAKWHLKLSLRHFKSINEETSTMEEDELTREQENYLEEAYEQYMEQNCTCHREESDCQCMNFEQFCHHHICELQHELEQYEGLMAYERKFGNF